MGKTLRIFAAGWLLLMTGARLYETWLDARPLPIELQDTCITGRGLCQDPEEVCINHQCEAEQE